MQIQYSTEKSPTAAQVIELYNKSALPRPTNDTDRIQKMYESSNLVITAWHDDKLVGVCRCITDWAWSCYLADLAVDPEYKKSGIGKKLIELTKEKVGQQVMILLLSVPTAFDYYPKVGFEKENRAFSMSRKK